MISIPRPTTAAQRRLIFERVLARYAEQGVTLDDPVYLRLMNAWIAGEIEMSEAAAHWNSVRLSRVAERRTVMPAIDTSIDDVARDLASSLETELEIVESDLPDLAIDTERQARETVWKRG